MKHWVVVAALLVCVACGGDDDDATTGNKPTTTSTSTTETTTASTTSTTTAGSTTKPPDDAADISLSVKVTGTGQPRSATLSCGATAAGTGFLAAPDTAAKACDLLRTNDAAVKRLVYGPPDGLLCTDVYGGPEIAKVTGTIQGQSVNAVINRVNGCGISDWNTYAALIGPAG